MIISPPFAYAEQRLKRFNSGIFFFVPATPEWFVPSNEELESQTGNPASINARQIRQDYFKRNALTWPVSWIVVGVCMTGLLWRSLAPEQPLPSRNAACLRIGLFAGRYIAGQISDSAIGRQWPYKRHSLLRSPC
ncbi:MAG: hypothetical protein J2P49_06365 [Methylocapsa sp.]|nr:hypothetical protein [Methylocapsa sp.]